MKTLYRMTLAGALCAYAAGSHAVGPRPAPAPQKQVLTVGYVKVGHLSPIIFVADDLKACNVEVKPVEFVRYADARTALLSGSVDVSGIGPADLAIALAQGSQKLVGLSGVASSPKYLVTRKGVKMDEVAGAAAAIAEHLRLSGYRWSKDPPREMPDSPTYNARKT